MAIGETTVTVVGNVVSDLVHRKVGDGADLVGFWMKSNERRFDKEAGAWVDGKSFAVKVTCWRRLAANVVVSISKGDPVIVTGKLYTSEYEADGTTRYTTELEAFAVGPNLNRCSAWLQRVRRGDVPVAVPWQPQPAETPAANGAGPAVAA